MDDKGKSLPTVGIFGPRAKKGTLNAGGKIVLYSTPIADVAVDHGTENTLNLQQAEITIAAPPETQPPQQDREQEEEISELKVSKLLC